MELANEYRNFAGYKINIQKCIAYLYTDNYQEDKEENNPILNCIKKNKYLEINLTKEVKDIYSENYKTLMKEFGNNTKKWKYFIIIFLNSCFV